MKTQKWIVRLASGALVALTLAGVALAAGQQGTQADPLVTLSYLNDKATPAIMAQVDAKLTQRAADLAAQLKKIADGAGQSGQAPGAQASAFTVVTLTQGQTLTAKVGCEILLRAGSASCVSESAPGLIDMTGGSTLGGGGALVQNHLYLCTADGRGVKAGTAVTLLVRGGYTVA